MKKLKTKVLGSASYSSIDNDKVLSSASLDAKFFGHAGFPASTDSLAYDPIQRLLAVGTGDGRVKVLGKAGVEHTFPAFSRCDTQFLTFLLNKAALLRIAQDGEVQVWGVEDRGLLHSMQVGDSLRVTALAAFRDEPYVLLGCQDGSIRVLSVLGQDGGLAVGISKAESLQEMPYEISSADLDGEGPVVGLAVYSAGQTHRVLAVYSNGAAVWDIRQEAALAKTELAYKALAAEGSGEASLPPWTPARTGCWLGLEGDCFATGHENGDILLWGVPDSDRSWPVAQPALPLGSCRVNESRGPTAPIKLLTYVASRPSRLLVLGGQSSDQPDMLSLIPCRASASGEASEEPHTLPWFGAVKGLAVVPPEGSLTADAPPAAIIVLTEGGQLMLHDLATLQPVPLSLPFQELAAVTVALFAHCGEDVTEPSLPQAEGHALTLRRLREASKAAAKEVQSVRSFSGRWRWVFGGGRPPVVPREEAPHPPDVYITGHRDGRVRVWDMATNTPALLFTVPFDSGGAGAKLRSVTAVQVCPTSGLLAVAHDKGEVRVYQFWQGKEAVASLTLGLPVEASPVAEDEPRRQPPGFQFLLLANLHSAPVQAISICSAAGLIALGDSSGSISLIDITQPKALYVHSISQQPILSLEFGSGQTARKEGAVNEIRLMLYALLGDSTIAVVDAESGEAAAKDASLQPRHLEAQPPLGLLLLSPRGAPAVPPAGPITLEWARSPAVEAEEGGWESPSGPSLPEPEWDDALSSLPAATSDLSTIPSSTTTFFTRPSDFSTVDSREVPESPRLELRRSGSADCRTDPAAPRSQPVRMGSVPLAGSSLSPPGRSSMRGSREEGGSEASTPRPSRREPLLDPHKDRDDDSDSDNDDLLAAAAAAVEAEEHEMNKKRGNVFSRLKAKTQKQLGVTHKPEDAHDRDLVSTSKLSVGRWARKSQESALQAMLAHEHTPEPDEGVVRTPRGEAGPCMPEASAGTPPRSSGAPAVPRPAGPLGTPRNRPAGFLPPEGLEPVAFLLLVTPTRLRLYPADVPQLRDVSTLRRKELDSRLSFRVAAPFVTPEGPGLLTLTSSANLQIYSLPGLEEVQTRGVEDILGFPWSWEPDPHNMPRLQTLTAVSPTGQMVMVGPGGELARLAVAANLGPPSWPDCLHDWDLSLAAAAASKALAGSSIDSLSDDPSSTSIHREAVEGGEDKGRGRRPLVGGMSRPESFKTGPSSIGHGLGGFLGQVRDAAKSIVDDTVEGLPKLARQLNQGVDHLGRNILSGRPFGGQGPSPADNKKLPSLDDLFNGRVPDDSPLASPTGPLPASGSRQPSLSGELASPSGLVRYTEDPEASKPDVRREASRPAGPDGKPATRTAEEIKAAYGRPAKKAGELGTMMNETRAALAERGERLSRLQDKTSAMEEDAASFAAMAKQIRDREASRKWFPF